MKLKSEIALMAAGSVALLLSASSASGQWGRFYVKADAGGNWTDDTSLKEFFGEPLTAGSKVKFHPGGRFGVAAGFHLTEWLSTEVETGTFVNSIDTITDATRVDAVFSNVPLLGNVRLQCPRCKWVIPYIGGGAGASFPVIDSDRIEIGVTSMHGSDADAVFAYQAFAGLRFNLNERMGLGVEYRYFHADGAEWKAEFTSGTISDRMRFGETDTHAVSIAFDYRF